VKKAVLDMMDRRPMWAMPDWVVEQIRAVLPEGWTLVVIEEESDGSGDGRGRVSAEVLAEIPDAEVYLGFGIPAELLEAGPDLRWVHSGAAGVGGSLTPQMLESDVVFTNSKGVHGPPIAETVLGMILYFARGLDFAAGGMCEGRWVKEPYYEAESPLREISGSTVGIIGFGGVGQEIASRMAPLGAKVLGLRRSGMGEWESWIEPASPAKVPEAPKTIDAAEEPAYLVTNLSGAEGLERLLSESDYVVISAPATAATERLIDRDALEHMKDGAVLVNVSRGSLVDEEALIDALRSGKLRGAGLDVFAREPLPDESPLWGFANVLITPHVSAVTSEYWKRQTQLITWNFKRYENGQTLLNEVDKSAGY
jgi:phosphoglycerate dehydrogenase-like enzyme